MKLIQAQRFYTNLAHTSLTTKITLLEVIDLVFGWHGNCTNTHFFQFRWFGFSKKRTRVIQGRVTQLRVPWASLLYRSPGGAETIFWLRHQWHLIDWNSEQLARRFGQYIETDFGGYQQYSGRLGRHVNMH